MAVLSPGLSASSSTTGPFVDENLRTVQFSFIGTLSGRLLSADQPGAGVSQKDEIAFRHIEICY